jgi:hypothetical protein
MSGRGVNRAKTILGVLLFVVPTMRGQLSLAITAPSDTPPKSPPPSCSSHVLAISNLSGSDAFVRLRLELEALEVAQEGYVRGAGVKENTSEVSGSTVQLADMLSRNRDGIEAMQCAAYLMGQYRAKGDENVLARSFLIIGFNSYAFALESLDALIREQLVRPKSKQTASIALKDADRYAALMKAQQNGGEIITEATSVSFNMAKDMSAGEDKEIQFLQLNCDEHATLYKMSGEIVAPPDTYFSAIADLLHDALSKFKCKQMARTTLPHGIRYQGSKSSPTLKASTSAPTFAASFRTSSATGTPSSPRRPTPPSTSREKPSSASPSSPTAASPP